MDFMGFVWHIAGLLAPAPFVAAGVTLLALLVDRKWPSLRVVLRRIAINAVVCAAVLLAGLALTGHDGRMATYAVLVLACAAAQAWQTRR